MSPDKPSDRAVARASGFKTFRPPYSREEVEEVIANLRDVGKSDGWVCASVGADMIEHLYAMAKDAATPRDTQADPFADQAESVVAWEI